MGQLETDPLFAHKYSKFKTPISKDHSTLQINTLKSYNDEYNIDNDNTFN